MLRIAKSSPGILDLSAVKDESGLPVTLNGASHRDVPDHEEDNPILQRVRDMQWVTVTRLPVDVPEDTATMVGETAPPEDTAGTPLRGDSESINLGPATDARTDDPVTTDSAPESTSESSSPSPATNAQGDDQVATNVASEPTSESPPNAPSMTTKPDRRSSRRS